MADGRAISCSTCAASLVDTASRATLTSPVELEAVTVSNKDTHLLSAAASAAACVADDLLSSVSSCGKISSYAGGAAEADPENMSHHLLSAAGPPRAVLMVGTRELILRTIGAVVGKYAW
jgi:hypothetical protein